MKAYHRANLGGTWDWSCLTPRVITCPHTPLKALPQSPTWMCSVSLLTSSVGSRTKIFVITWSWQAVVYLRCKTNSERELCQKRVMLNVKLLVVNVTYVLIDNQELAVYWLNERWVILLNMHIHTLSYQMRVREQWIPVIENSIFYKGRKSSTLPYCLFITL